MDRRKNKHPYIEYFYEKYKKEILENNLDITNSNSFSKCNKNDLFKELENGLFIYHFCNGDFYDKILDLGSSTMLQPSVIKLLQNTNTFNLEIDKETRIKNLYKDFIFHANKRKTCIYKVINNAKKEYNNISETDLKKQIDLLRDKYLDEFLILNDSEKKLDDILKKSIKLYDDSQSFRFRYLRRAKYTISNTSEILNEISFRYYLYYFIYHY